MEPEDYAAIEVHSARRQAHSAVPSVQPKRMPVNKTLSSDIESALEQVREVSFRNKRPQLEEIESNNSTQRRNSNTPTPVNHLPDTAKPKYNQPRTFGSGTQTPDEADEKDDKIFHETTHQLTKERDMIQTEFLMPASTHSKYNSKRQEKVGTPSQSPTTKKEYISLIIDIETNSQIPIKTKGGLFKGTKDDSN